MHRLTVEPRDEGRRVDELIAVVLRSSRAQARRLLAAGLVRLDGRVPPKGLLVRAGQKLVIDAEAPGPSAPRPQADAPLDVLLVDEVIVVVAKAAGQPCHPLRPGELGTLANALVARYPECATASDDPREGGLVHRIDVATSGVLVAARTHSAWQTLRDAFRDHAVDKVYWAAVRVDPARPLPDTGEIDAPLGHGGRRRMTTGRPRRGQAQPARSEYRVLARAQGVALVEVTTATGRMHQVRAHLASLGCPLDGDVLYGGPPSPDGHLLHARSITLPHPTTGVRLTIEAPLSAHRLSRLARLGLQTDLLQPAHDAPGRP